MTRALKGALPAVPAMVPPDPSIERRAEPPVAAEEVTTPNDSTGAIIASAGSKQFARRWDEPAGGKSKSPSTKARKLPVTIDHAPTEPPADDPELADLADKIRAEHDATTISFGQALEHAIKAGELLTTAKKKLMHGRWLPWLRDYCQVSERMARYYMQLAREMPKFSRSATPVADFSIREALAQITTQTQRLSRLPAPVVEKAFGEEKDHGRLKAVLKQAESIQRHREFKAREQEEKTRREAAGQPTPDPVAPRAPLPDPLADWLAPLRLQLRYVVGQFLAKHPDDVRVAVCEVLNNVYCDVQEGKITAETHSRERQGGLQ